MVEQIMGWILNEVVKIGLIEKSELLEKYFKYFLKKLYGISDVPMIPQKYQVSQK